MAVSPRTRFEVFKRDRFRCVYCGRSAADDTELHVDHVHPTSRGGTDEIDNLVTACAECNLGKSDIPIGEQAAPVISLAGIHTCQEWFADAAEARRYGRPRGGECGAPATFAIFIDGMGGHWSCGRCARFYDPRLIYRLDSIPLPPARL